jgi:hypothetical protein
LSNAPAPKPPITVVVETDRYYWSYLPCDREVAEADARNILAAHKDYMQKPFYNGMATVYERPAKWPE